MSRSEEYFSSEHLRTDLKGKTVRGGLYAAAAQGLMVMMSLAAIPVLTRLLAPGDFGLVAMVTVFTGIAAMFVDAGLTMATVQREELTHQQVSNLFWVAAALGLGVGLLIVAASPLVAWFYGEPRLVPITAALAAAPLFSGLTVQHQALLRRTMRLRQLAAVQVTCNFLGYTFAIGVAWQYRSYWALVVLPVSVALLRMAGTWIACSWRPGLPRRGAGARAMVRFGANLTGFNFANYFARSGDNMLLGWAWGDVALGYYERAYRLMMAPLHHINGPLAGLMIPVLSRLNRDPVSYRSAYLRAVAVFQVVSCPLMAFVAVMAPAVVQIAFGSQYAESVSILRWLAIAGFIQPLLSSFGWLYISQGRSRDLMQWGLLGCSLIVLSFLAGLPWGPEGVARAYAGTTCLVIAPLAIWFVGRKGPVTRADLVTSTGTAIAMSAPAALGALLATAVAESEPAALRLALGAAASASVTVPLLFLTRQGRWLTSQIHEIRRLSAASKSRRTIRLS